MSSGFFNVKGMSALLMWKVWNKSGWKPEIWRVLVDLKLEQQLRPSWPTAGYSTTVKLAVAAASDFQKKSSSVLKSWRHSVSGTVFLCSYSGGGVIDRCHRQRAARGSKNRC